MLVRSMSNGLQMRKQYVLSRNVLVDDDHKRKSLYREFVNEFRGCELYVLLTHSRQLE